MKWSSRPTDPKGATSFFLSMEIPRRNRRAAAAWCRCADRFRTARASPIRCACSSEWSRSKVVIASPRVEAIGAALQGGYAPRIAAGGRSHRAGCGCSLRRRCSLATPSHGAADETRRAWRRAGRTGRGGVFGGGDQTDFGRDERRIARHREHVELRGDGLRALSDGRHKNATGVVGGYQQRQIAWQ